jgi:diguanylate cyclase (GGDEF)-like protein
MDNMGFMDNVVINIYSIVILIIIYFNSSKQDEKESLQQKLYMVILQLTMLMLVIDIFSRFDGKPDSIYQAINHFGNFVMFLLNPIVPSLWLLYVHYQTFQEENKIRELIYPLLLINVINVCMLVLTQFFGWYYYIDLDNIYHRGSLFWFPTLITVGLIFAAFILIVVNRDKIERKYYFSLAFFAVPPLVCIILQVVFYGTSLVLNGVVLSLLIVFLKIQNHSMHIDYLTEVYNRKKLEVYMKEKINGSTEDKTFSAILIDLNNFKSINDTFGHDTGDNALRIFAKLLSNCLRPNDCIARFGGDEFCIVLDVSNRMDLESIVLRIDNCIDKFNNSDSQPYKLGYSMGYAIYDYHSHMTVEEFQKHIDRLMYENKQAYKEENKIN